MAVDTVGWPDEDDRSGFWPTEERWYMCDYCGWLYPKSDTRVESHTGLRACITGPNDYNDPGYHDEHLRGMRLRLILRGEEEQTV